MIREVIEVPHEAPDTEVFVGGAGGPAGLAAGAARVGKSLQRVVYEPGMSMAEVERAAIEAALADTGGNRRKAAEMLGIGERTLYRKLKEYEAGGGSVSTPT